MKSADSIPPCGGPVAGERLPSEVTVLAIEQALAESGIHAKPSDIVAKAQAIENEIIQPRSRRKREHLC
jgi:hypothetical protein